MQPQQMNQPGFGGEIPGHGMEPAPTGQPNDMPPKTEAPNQTSLETQSLNNAKPSPVPETVIPIDPRTGEQMENPLRDTNGKIVEGYTPSVQYDYPNINTGQALAAEAPSPATAPAPPPPPPGGPNGPSDNGINPNDPDSSLWKGNDKPNTGMDKVPPAEGSMNLNAAPNMPNKNEVIDEYETRKGAAEWVSSQDPKTLQITMEEIQKKLGQKPGMEAYKQPM